MYICVGILNKFKHFPHICDGPGLGSFLKTYNVYVHI